MLTPGRSWRLGALLVTASLLAAACGASAPAANHGHRSPAVATTAPGSATTSATAGNTGNSGTGNTGTGNSGTGNTGTGNTGTGTSTTGAGAPKIATATSTPTYTTTPSGKVRARYLGPGVARFKPVSSPVGGTVTIIGRRLAHATTVSINGIPAKVKANGSTKIKAVVPPGATSGPITVVTPYGSATVYGFIVT